MTGGVWFNLLPYRRGGGETSRMPAYERTWKLTAKKILQHDPAPEGVNPNRYTVM